MALVETDQGQQNGFHSGFLPEDTCTLCQRKIALGQLVKRRLNRTAAGNHNDIPAGRKPFFIQTVNLPDTAAGTVSNMCLTQLLADGNTHPVDPGTVPTGIKHQITIRNTLAAVKPLEYVIKLQTGRILHLIIPISLKKSFSNDFSSQAFLQKGIVDQTARDFGASQSSDLKEYFLYPQGGYAASVSRLRRQRLRYISRG